MILIYPFTCVLNFVPLMPGQQVAVDPGASEAGEVTYLVHSLREMHLATNDLL